MDTENRAGISQTGSTDRLLYIDFIKILAIVLVVFNHTNLRGFLLFAQNRDSVLYPFYLFNAVWIKIAVPLFFMCSGALLLGKQESYRVLLRKRFLRFLVVLILASVMMYLFKRLRTGKELSVSGFLVKFYRDGISDLYWYLYRFLAYLLMLPLLRKIANGMAKADCRWIVVLFCIIRIIPLAEFLIWKGKVELYSKFYLFVELDYVFYPLIGYYIDKRELPEKNGKTLLLLSLASLASIGIGCVMTHYRCTLLDAWEVSNCQKFLENLIFVPTITVFYACKVWFSRHKPGLRAQKVIVTLSGLTFGIYLLEGIGRTATLGIDIFLKPYIHSLPASWVWVACVCILCGLAVYLLKKIPGVKKYL